MEDAECAHSLYQAVCQIAEGGDGFTVNILVPDRSRDSLTAMRNRLPEPYRGSIEVNGKAAAEVTK